MSKGLIARLVLFAVMIIWDLALLAYGFVFGSNFRDDLLTEGRDTWVTNIFTGWYDTTLILVAAYVAYRAFRQVGKIERD